MLKNLSLIFLCLLVLHYHHVALAENKNHKTITIKSGCEYDYPPYCIVDKNQKADGFSVELLREALKSAGYDV